MSNHKSDILDQFTKQSALFAKAQPMHNQELLTTIIRTAAPKPDDRALDVACGPGILTCAMAKHVAHITGSDIVPAMLEQAKILQAGQKLSNITWELGDVKKLPYGDASFDLVVTRFSFHHFENPLAALQEMKRITKRGGRIVVIDSSPAADKSEGFNKMEKLRDPSHTKALSHAELTPCFEAAGLLPILEPARLHGDLDSLLARSFPPHPDDKNTIRAMFERALSDDFMDARPVRTQKGIEYDFPIAIVSAVTS